jgi:hypothetical protein
MAIERAQINIADLLARWTTEAKPRLTSGDRSADPQVKPQVLATRLSGVPDGDDLPGIALGGFRDGVTDSFLEHVEAAFVGAHVPRCRALRIGQVVINNVGLCPSLPTTLPGW